ERVDDTVVVDQPDHVDEIRDGARMVRHDADAIARREARVAGNAYGRVLFGEAFDQKRLVERTRRFALSGEHGAVAGGRRDAARLIAGQRLAAAVENDPAGMLRDDRRQHGERAIVERGGAERDLRPIEVDVVAGTLLGDAVLADAEAQ